jgi:anti-sigma factor RsiW
VEPDEKNAEADSALREALETKLPRHAAPLELRRRLAAQWPSVAPVEASRTRRRALTFGLALAAAVTVVVSGAAILIAGRSSDLGQLDREAVNDHLRILGGAPLAQVTGGLHEVKPWFGGKLDFAPSVSFAGDDDFPIQGGAVEEFLDRRAAVFVYKRRLHTASLFVLDAQGREFPSALQTANVRGFNVALWKQGDQGFALVSDLNLPELLDLQRRIATAKPPH